MTEWSRLEVAVYGLINAGKSSLVNALCGTNDLATSPIGGTTRAVTDVGWREVDADVSGFRVHLLDTPGLEEIGDDTRSKLATEAARRADLVLFVVAEDLTDTALDAIRTLHEVGKPIVVALNKVDLLDAFSESAILDSIRHRLVSLVDPTQVISIAAAPIVRERVTTDDGKVVVKARHGDPEIDALRALLLAAVADSGANLKGLNAIREEVETHTVVRDRDKADRRLRAVRTADETSVALALALAVNPIPLIDFLTGPGGLLVLVTRVSAVYDEKPDRDSARAIARELFRGGRVVLWGSMAAVVGGGAMKLIPGLGHLAGAVTQGAAAGYLAHVLGRGLVDYLENGHNWGDEGLVATLDRIASETNRKAITRGIVDRIKARLSAKGESR